MNKKILFLSFLPGIILEVVLLLLKVNPIAAMVISGIVMLSSYLGWWSFKNAKTIGILDEKCDPELFIERCEKDKRISKRAAFQNLCNLNIAVGLNSLGRNEEAIGYLLHECDLNIKNSKIFGAVYHLALFSCYLDMDDMDKATDIYNNHLMDLRKEMFLPRVTLALDMSVSEYLFKLDKTDETAKLFMNQLDYYYNTCSGKMSKRLTLSIMYNKAEILLALGNKESAAQNYKAVAKNGNKLYIAQRSRLRLKEMGIS